MLSRFKQFVDAQHLIPYGGKVLLAVSGGRDSVCMAHLFHRAAIPFAVAHCNFHLRPGDCDRDQQFVRTLAATLGADFYTTDFDTRDYASRHHLGIEDAARRLRYDYFASLLQRYGFCAVATAHHRDDSIETFFLNLFRGTGIAGLHGIRPLSTINGHLPSVDGHLSLIRPMLCFSRADIDDYILRHGLDYVEDVTNSQLDARRNRVRLQLMPLLRELYPSADDIMEANIERFHQAEQVCDYAIATLRQRILHPLSSPLGLRFDCYDISLLLGLDPQRPLLYGLLQPYGFSSAVVDNILAALPEARTGARFLSPTYLAAIDRNRLLVTERFVPTPPRVAIESVALIPQPVAHCPMQEFIDADLVRQPLSVRRWRRGDRFCPFGMSQQRLLSDFLKDCKINVFEKQCVYVLVDADDRIVWVIGLRLDNRFRITSATRSVLRLEATIG